MKIFKSLSTHKSIKSIKKFFGLCKKYGFLLWPFASLLTQILSLTFLLQALFFTLIEAPFFSIMPWIYFGFFFILLVTSNLKSLYYNFLWKKSPTLVLINAFLPLNFILMSIVIVQETLLLKKKQKTQEVA